MGDGILRIRASEGLRHMIQYVESADRLIVPSSTSTNEYVLGCELILEENAKVQPHRWFCFSSVLFSSSPHDKESH